MNKRDVVILSILGITLASGIGYIILGERGIISYYKLKKEIELEQKQIKDLEQEIINLQAKIDSWKSDEFHTEKFARQDLQMGKTDEQVYVLTNTNQKT